MDIVPHSRAFVICVRNIFLRHAAEKKNLDCPGMVFLVTPPPPTHTHVSVPTNSASVRMHLCDLAQGVPMCPTQIQSINFMLKRQCAPM